MRRHWKLYSFSLALGIITPWMVLAQQSDQESALGTFTTIDIPGATRS
jgi:hypothetical protein